MPVSFSKSSAIEFMCIDILRLFAEIDIILNANRQGENTQQEKNRRRSSER